MTPCLLTSNAGTKIVVRVSARVSSPVTLLIISSRGELLYLGPLNKRFKHSSQLL